MPEILSQGSNPIRERRDNGFDAGDDAVINETLDFDSQLSPADDIKFILYSLFSADAFFVIPSQVYLFPPLPSVNILDSRNKTKEQSAKVLLATEQEMKLLQNGKLQTLIPDLESFDHWTPKLREAEAAYVAEKYNGFTSIFQTPLTQSIINRGQEMTYNTIKRLKEDDTNVSSTKAGTEDFSAFASKDLFGLVASHGLSSVATSFEETLARMETE